MSILSWNCQGAGSPEAVPRLREMRRSHFPDFLFLMETKQQKRFMLGVKESLGYDELLTVDPIGLSGGLALFWKKCYGVEILSSDNRIIDVKVTIGSLVFFISFVYGDSVRELRASVWDKLSHIGLLRNEAWLLAGDFNELLQANEKLGGPVREEPTFWDFRCMVQNCKIRELRSTGNSFSWAGWRETLDGLHYVQCKLDRAFANEEWLHWFPRSYVEYLSVWASDHRPISISFVHDPSAQPKGRFCFEKRWLNQPGLEAAIHDGWNQHEDNMPLSLSTRITSCRSSLSRWKKHTNPNSKSRLDALKAALDLEASKMFPDANLLISLKRDIAVAYREEEKFWKQKSRDRWLKEGDRNSKFFHNSVKGQRMRNKIVMLKNSDEVDNFTEGSKGQIATDYFREIFTSSDPSDMEALLDGIERRVDDSINDALTQPVTPDEIKNAVFSIKSDSAPGSDGFTAAFYKAFWHIVGPDIISEITSFFSYGEFPLDWNHTQICLLPKKENPCRMTDLRPISLCSVHYKIISKILCDRLKPILPSLISSTQGAFVSGRLITDNILVAHELVHALRTKDNVAKEYMAIKTDMSKAYDRVEWSFLEHLMTKMGFNETWIRWIMFCISTVSYSVLLNGQPHGFIKPERGLRQGDPLSPFLFILGAEALVNVLHKADNEERIHGIRITDESPSVHHLLFADDSLLLCRANVSESTEILRCLELYGAASGQQINPTKSSIIFGQQVDEETKHEVKLALGISSEGGDGTYLGLPECFSGSKRKLLQFIHDKLRSRLKGWFAKALSQGGREILIKSIALALPVYAMSCFRLSKDLCEKLTSALIEFWWSNGCNRRKISWVAWKKLCYSKEDGGMGFHDIEAFNQALLGKQAWRILDNPDSLLSQIYRSRYFPQSTFLEASKGNRPSYAWRSILFGRDLLVRGLVKTIGDGASTKAFSDNWISVDGPRPLTWRQQPENLMLKVSELLFPQGTWREDVVRDLFTAEDASIILDMKPSPLIPDSFAWCFSKTGCYSTRSGYQFLSLSQPLSPPMPIPPMEKAVWKKIWSLKVPSKIQHFLWRILSGAVPVLDRLQSRGVALDPVCPTCGAQAETICHMLFSCSLATQMWQASGLITPSSGFSNSSAFLNIYFLFNKNPVNVRRSSQTISFPWLLWNIWKARNGLVFDRIRLSENVILTRTKEEESIWHQANAIAPRQSMSTLGAAPSPVLWRRPPAGYFKCNVGVQWNKSNKEMGVGWITRDSTGSTINHGRNFYARISSGLEAELLGLFWAIESTAAMRGISVMFVCSSRQAVDAVSSPAGFPSFRSLTAEISHRLSHIPAASILFSPFQSNGPALAMAKSVIRDGRPHSYIARGPPLWLQDQLEQEATSS